MEKSVHHANGIRPVKPVGGSQGPARVRHSSRTPAIPTIDISNFSAEIWKKAHHYSPAVSRPAFGAESGSREKGAASPLETLKLYNTAAANVARGDTIEEGPSIHVSARIRNGGEIPAEARNRPAPPANPEGNAPRRSTGCDTCDSRRYQDGSHDSGVSFQSAKGMPASTAGRFVASHEGEHVSRETAKAREEGQVVTQKKVTMEMGFCPDCNRLYAKGGKTTIQTQERPGDKSAGGNAVVTRMEDILKGNGERFNMNL